MGAKQPDDLGVGAGAAEQKTLPLVAALGAQAAQFGFGLDAFGGDGDAEALAEADDRTHDRLAFAVGAEIAPGVPVLRTVGQAGPDMLLALKSGNFGGPGFFSDALDLMR